MKLTNLKRELKKELKENIKRGVAIIQETKEEDAKNNWYLKEKTTKATWNKFLNNEITFKELKAKAIERMKKEYLKSYQKELDELEYLESIGRKIKQIRVETYFTAYGVGIARVTIYTKDYPGFYTLEGKAGGWGYDKESAAVANALNGNEAFKKALYEAKEKALRKGKKGDNNTILHYGAGYGVLPYLDGGVGMSSVAGVLECLDLKCTVRQCLKNENFYIFE